MAFQAAWALCFSAAPAHIRLASPCPICAAPSLFRWHDGARGLWEWCQSCHAYEHSSALPPKSWQPEVVIAPDGAKLTVEPSAIIEALTKVHFYER